MIELQDGMLLYHGSYISIPEIDLNRCFGGLDFGRGFYLTSSYEQAYNYVQLSIKKAMRIGNVSENFNPADGQISVYKFHYDPNILAYCFQGAQQAASYPIECDTAFEKIWNYRYYRRKNCR